jgi:hypothetical protein
MGGCVRSRFSCTSALPMVADLSSSSRVASFYGEEMGPRRKIPHKEKQLAYRKRDREHAWHLEAGLRLWRRRRKTTKARVARRIENQLLSQANQSIEDVETLDFDAARRRLKRPKYAESLREALDLNAERRLRRANRKKPEARSRRAMRRGRSGSSTSMGPGSDSPT